MHRDRSLVMIILFSSNKYMYQSNSTEDHNLVTL